MGYDTVSLDQAEEAALATTCRRAQIEDGMTILELGCGWGSLSLWMAERYPGSRILAVSNSASQRQFIQGRAAHLGLTNLTVVTADMNVFQTLQTFDRVVSVEMFEHMRNHRELFRRISTWLNPQGKLFVHIFCHRLHSYLFETNGNSDWMAKHFFSGGMMPGESLLAHCQQHLELSDPALGRQALRADLQRMAETTGCKQGTADTPVPRNLRSATGCRLAESLADVFHGMCRIVWIPPRKRVVGLALPV